VEPQDDDRTPAERQSASDPTRLTSRHAPKLDPAPDRTNTRSDGGSALSVTDSDGAVAPAGSVKVVSYVVSGASKNAAA